MGRLAKVYNHNVLLSEGEGVDRRLCQIQRLKGTARETPDHSGFIGVKDVG